MGLWIEIKHKSWWIFQRIPRQ